MDCQGCISIRACLFGAVTSHLLAKLLTSQLCVSRRGLLRRISSIFLSCTVGDNIMSNSAGHFPSLCKAPSQRSTALGAAPNSFSLSILLSLSPICSCTRRYLRTTQTRKGSGMRLRLIAPRPQSALQVDRQIHPSDIFNWQIQLICRHLPHPWALLTEAAAYPYHLTHILFYRPLSSLWNANQFQPF